jgi:AraC-like DNA-binding protein
MTTINRAGRNHSGPAVNRFSTDELPSRDRLAVLHDVVGRRNLRMEIDPLDGAPVDVRLEWLEFPSVLLTVAATNAVRLARTPELVRDGDGAFRLLQPVSAPIHIACEGMAADRSAGDAMLVFNGAPSTLRLLGQSEIISLRADYDSLAPALRRAEERAINPLASTPAPRLLLGYATLLRRQEPIVDPVLARHVSRQLIDLLALAIGPTSETRERARGGALRAARLATIRADVLANLSEARLSARTVARRHGLSDRYIHKLFEESGQTFGQFVQEERLQRALAHLSDPARMRTPISEIAVQAGFSEPSSFNRAFRRRFGDTPGQFRRGRNDEVT